MHHSPDSHIFLAPAFVGIVTMNDWVYGHFRTPINFKVIECRHMQDASGKAGTPLGHMYPVPIEFA